MKRGEISEEVLEEGQNDGHLEEERIEMGKREREGGRTRKANTRRTERHKQHREDER